MRKQMKKMTTFALVAGLSVVSATTAFAGQWKLDNVGWWWQEDDGSYPTNAWKEINGKWYYFDGVGYMLENTTTPDGYKVGADGAWLVEQSTAVSATINKENYYKKAGVIAFSATTMLYYQNLKLYAANLDGSNKRLINDNHGNDGIVLGVDNKFYFSDENGTLYRSDANCNNIEALYTDAPSPNYLSNGELIGWFPGTMNLQYADSNGIQLKEGYYNINTQTFTENLKADTKNPNDISQLNWFDYVDAVPHNDYEWLNVKYKDDIYVVVESCVRNPNAGYFGTHFRVGNYIINTKNNKCVGYIKGTTENPITSDEYINGIHTSECGLIVTTSNGIYRVENGGAFTTLYGSGESLDTKLYDTWVYGNRLYYKTYDGEFRIISLPQVELPTQPVK